MRAIIVLRRRALVFFVFGVLFLWPYFVWQKPIYPVEYVFWWFGFPAGRLGGIISIFLVAICPYSCMLFGCHYYLLTKGLNLVLIKYLAGMLSFIGGVGYLVTIVIKELFFYGQFSTWVAHDYLLAIVHVGLACIGIKTLLEIRNETFNLKVLSIAVVLTLLFGTWVVLTNPWFEDVRPWSAAGTISMVLVASSLMVPVRINRKLLFIKA